MYAHLFRSLSHLWPDGDAAFQSLRIDTSRLTSKGPIDLQICETS